MIVECDLIFLNCGQVTVHMHLALCSCFTSTSLTPRSIPETAGSISITITMTSPRSKKHRALRPTLIELRRLALRRMPGEDRLSCQLMSVLNGPHAIWPMVFMLRATRVKKILDAPMTMMPEQLHIAAQFVLNRSLQDRSLLGFSKKIFSVTLLNG